MQNICSILSLFTLIAQCTAANKSWRGYKVLRLKPTSNNQIQWLRMMHNDHSLDFWSPSDVMVAPKRIHSFKQQLQEIEIPWDILIPDVQTTVDQERSRQLTHTQKLLKGPSISFEKYNRYEEIKTFLKQLSSDNPSIVTYGSIGRTTEGRDIPYVTISSAGPEETDVTPIILVDGGIHAREWISPALALYIIQQLVENPRNKDLTNEVTWIIIPLLNPDGYEYAHTTDRMWRKTRSKQTECYGVDLNRNFNIHWMEAGASSNECSDTYGGPNYFSEPEARALRGIAFGNKMRIQMYITLHSYGNYILYPWSYDYKVPRDEKRLLEVAERANDAQVAAGGNRYTVGPGAITLYRAAGGSDDWVKSKAGVPFSYTVELPGGGAHGFDLPETEIFKTVSTFFPAIRVWGEHVAHPFYVNKSPSVSYNMTHFPVVVGCILVILNIYS